MLIVFLIISSTGITSAQDKASSQINCSISSQLQLRMNQHIPANFYVPANSEQETIGLSGAVQIDIQTNRKWILNVKDLNGESTSANGQLPLESLRIRADGKTFIPLDEKEINLSRGNKGAYGSAGNSISIDYELTFRKSRLVRNYQIDLLYTLVAI